MNILITGGTGLLGKALIESKNNNDQIVASYFGDYNVLDQESVKYLKLNILDFEGQNKVFSEFKPNIVIHAASIGSPDYAEQHKELTWSINVDGTAQLVKLCDLFGAKFIYISSNGIYDGEHAPYGEDDIAEPINYYGQTKLEGEARAKQAKTGWAIVRPILMYGWNNDYERANIVSMSIAKLKKRENIFAYDDVFCNPLLSSDCAKAIWRIIDQKLSGSFNIAGAEKASVFDLIRKTADVFGLDDSLINPVQQGFFNELVKRPIDTSYNTKKMEMVLGLKPLSLIEGLTRMKSTKK